MKKELIRIKIDHRTMDLSAGIYNFKGIATIKVDYIYSDYTVVTEEDMYNEEIWETMSIMLDILKITK